MMRSHRHFDCTSRDAVIRQETDALVDELYEFGVLAVRLGCQVDAEPAMQDRGGGYVVEREQRLEGPRRERNTTVGLAEMSVLYSSPVAVRRNLVAISRSAPKNVACWPRIEP